MTTTTTTVRPAADRGVSRFPGLDSRHTFSFGQYRDPNWRNFGPLRVINDDRLTPGAGFPTHPHHDMEIISVVVEGQLAHRDSQGNTSTLNPGDVQVMSAGAGIEHSEFNPSSTEGAHFVQIWITPNVKDATPAYTDLRATDADTTPGVLRLIASGTPRDRAVRINADADVYTALLDAGRPIVHEPVIGRRLFVQVISGSVNANGASLEEGDAIAIERADRLEMVAADRAHVLLFDLSEH